MNFRHLFILLWASITLFALPSCSKDDDTLPEDRPTPHTHIFYFTGSSLRLAFYNNISDAKDAIRQGCKGDSRVILFFQPTDRKMANIIELTYDNSLCEEEILATYQLPDEVTGDDLSYYFNEIIRLAPAEKYSLVMAGHSTAWVPLVETFSLSAATPQQRLIYENLWKKNESDNPTRYFGETYSPSTSNAFDITTLSEALASTGVKFEYIIFDACFMGNVEAMYEMRDNANYLIGSPCEIMSVGFPYNLCLPHMMIANKEYSLQQVCENFNTFYESTKGYSGSVALIDCAELDELARCVKAINNGTTQEYNAADLQTFEGQRQHTFFDLADYIEAYSADETLLAKFRTQLERTVVCKYTLDRFWSNYGNNSGLYPISTFCGLSTSAPSIH